jgi:hypothetical protein
MQLRAAVFVDTSIHIARALRAPAMRNRIESWLARYSLRISGSIARVEFRNRVLRDIDYLLTKLNQTRSYGATLRYVHEVLPRAMERKRRICVFALHRLLPGSAPRSDAELTERARRYCRLLLVFGETGLSTSIDRFEAGVGCRQATESIQERRPYRSYVFPHRACARPSLPCGIANALGQEMDLCRRLLAGLRLVPPEQVTTELLRSRDFLERVVEHDGVDMEAVNPCTTVGDLLLAIESAGVSDVYTMNWRESRFFCDVLDQDVAVRPNNPAAPEREYLRSKRPWPAPGRD